MGPSGQWEAEPGHLAHPASLAGAVEMMGNIHRYSDTLSNDTGYSGIVVAVLAGASEVGVVAAGIFFAGLMAAGNALRVAGLSSNAAFALLGLILLLAGVANGLARYRIARTRRGAPAEEGSR